MLSDNFGRKVDYVRIALTDKCNLRCSYCMPENGLPWKKQHELLSTGEVLRTLRILSELGFRKVRFTGGEPFARNDFSEILRETVHQKWFEDIHLTTNGTLLGQHIPMLEQSGISGINLSLDTLQPEKFRKITRRDLFREVWSSFEKLLDTGIPIKINAVVMDGINTDEIIDFCELTSHLPITIRFIEEMPFNGGNGSIHTWPHHQVFRHIENYYGAISRDPEVATETAYTFKIKEYPGKIGIIAAYSRTFCGTCNRLRITPAGDIKTCLYDKGVLSLRSLLRNSIDDGIIATAIRDVIGKRYPDGHAAELARYPIDESMATIGG